MGGSVRHSTCVECNHPINKCAECLVFKPKKKISKKKKIKRVKSNVKVVLLCLLFLVGCGSFQTAKKARYNLGLASGNPALIPLLQTNINYFNTRIGRNVLHWEADPSRATSTITIVDDLPSKSISGTESGAVGLGRYVITINSKELKTIQYYDMDLWFDEAFLLSMPEEESRILFLHEVGHGFELAHNDLEESDIMYPLVGGDIDKDYDKYFNYISNYLRDK